MSALHQITLVVPPSRDAESDRQFYRYDRFVEQLRPHTSATVSIVEDEFATPPSDGLILLHQYGATVANLGANNFEDQIETTARLWTDKVRKRIFCLNTARGNETLSMLNRLELAGAIDQIDYQVAVRELALGTSYGDSGLYGACRITESLGCTVDYSRERYCKTIVPPFASLGQLLGRYLEAYWTNVF